MLKQTQKNELTMVQRLSQRQILLMKLLQIPTVMLEQRINEELEQNPALEIDDEPDSNEDNFNEELSFEDNSNSDNVEDYSQQDDYNFDDYFSDDEQYNSSYEPKSYSHEQQLEDEKRNAYMESSYVSAESYQETLLAQLGMFVLSEEDRKILTFIVGSIDDSGFLTRTPDEIVNDLLFSMNISTTAQHIEDLLVNVVHKLDPAGSGARDLKECLLLQLNRFPETPDVILAKRIIEKFFVDFTQKHYDKIKKRLNCTDDDFSQAITCITNLDPKPGKTATTIENPIIVPDFEVTIDEKNQKINLMMTDANLPNLRISKMYSSLSEKLKDKSSHAQEKKEAIQFIRQKKLAAQWFIEALSQRERTLYKTMSEIIEHQKAFFLTGDKMQLKPMILKDIALAIGADISTISRVVKQKYVQTPYGVFPLKFFFSESIQKEDGEDVSSRKIQEIITNAINSEDKKNPLTDIALCETLNQAGYPVARRTVAKYREQLGFPVARLRK